MGVEVDLSKFSKSLCTINILPFIRKYMFVPLIYRQQIQKLWRDVTMNIIYSLLNIW